MKDLNMQVYKSLLGILTGEPGTGKSFQVIHKLVPKLIAEGKRVMYLLPSHDRVDEFMEKMVPAKKYVGGKEVRVKRTTTIWRGIRNSCPLYLAYLEQKNNNSMKHFNDCHYQETEPCGGSDSSSSQPMKRIIYSIYNSLYYSEETSEEVAKQLKCIIDAIDSGLPASIVCPVCSRLKIIEQLNISCTYRKQFATEKKLVLTVHDYLTTAYPKEFDVIIADDLSLLKSITLWPPNNLKELLETFMVLLDANRESNELIEVLGTEENLEKLRKVIADARNMKSLGDSLDKVLEAFKEIFGNEWFNRSFRSWYRFIVALARIQLEFLDLEEAKNFFELISFLQWLYYYTIYRKIQPYSRPYLFYLLDLAMEGKEVYLISANFVSQDTIKLLEHLLELYRLENGITEDITYSIEYIEPPDGPKGTVYFYLKVFDNSVTGRYPTKSIVQYKESLDRILTRVKWLLKHYNIPPDGNGLGIVTGKDLVYHVKNAFPRAQVIHYYNLEGSNKLADVKLLILIGTPEIGKENLLEIAKTLLLNHDFSNDEAIYLGPLLGYRYRDPLLDNLNRAIVDMEMFQAIHRARSIRRNVDVYVFAKPVALTTNIGLDVRWFDVTEIAIHSKPIYNFEKIRFGYKLTIGPHKKTVKLYGDLEELKRFLEHFNQKLVIGQEFVITYLPGTGETKLEVKRRYHSLRHL